MPAPTNTFKARLKAGDQLIGCWLSLADAGAAEIVGTTGFDWVLIDGEHSPNDIRSIRAQMAALDSSPSSKLVRVPVGEPWILKQVMDVGAQTVLVPMVESAAQAEAMVKACQYPPRGIRGVGAAAARAGGFGSYTDYVRTADDQICVLIQVESRAGLEALDDILAVDGLDGVFIGPADLSADMGFHGDANHPEARAAILAALEKIAASDKAAGILSLNDDVTDLYIAHGAQFVAAAIDVVLLARAARATVARFIG